MPTEKHYQCLCSQSSAANTMANPGNQAKMTLKDDDSVATLPSANYNITPSSEVKRVCLEVPIPAQNNKTQ